MRKTFTRDAAVATVVCIVGVWAGHRILADDVSAQAYGKARGGGTGMVQMVRTSGSSSLTSAEIRACYHRSYRYEKSQNYSDAVKALAVVHDQYPAAYTPNLRLAWLHYLKGNYANAEEYYLAATKAAPEAIEPKLGCLLPLLAQERYEAVEKLARQVIREDKGNYYANLRLAVALRSQDKTSQAEKTVNRMLRAYPTDVPFLAELALLKVAQDDLDAASQIFFDVLILDPENVTAKRFFSTPLTAEERGARP